MKCFFKMVGSFILLPFFLLACLLSVMVTVILIPVYGTIMLSGCVHLSDKHLLPYWVGELAEWWMDL